MKILPLQYEFKVGDVVRIIKKFDSSVYLEYISSLMDKMIGKSYTITIIHTQLHGVHLEGKELVYEMDNGYAWPWNSIRLSYENTSES